MATVEHVPNATIVTVVMKLTFTMNDKQNKSKSLFEKKRESKTNKNHKEALTQTRIFPY